MNDKFEQLYEKKSIIHQYNTTNCAIEFYQQEVLRFLSIAGTLKENGLSNNPQSVDARYFSHILTRSLIENFFIMIYVFDSVNDSETRFNEILNGFKQDYLKLYNESELPFKEELAIPQSDWKDLKKPKDVKSILNAVKNENEEKLGYLYFVYRITSFDTHGKNLLVFLQQSFENTSNLNFPILDINNILNLIANEYIAIWQQIEQK
ncbi:hypothetical protein ABVS_1093 [Acinetobacter lwoffii]|uniref:hypothetical protein n=1 Tax=Acinetobacter lwoffii TaxID=28090 RepID=UPI001C930FF7|nr:hypothetical protein [Acinetobacter lwoffii]QZM11792.1 hypothetical protein ABVS_1093 [Acinetobacter lwoffii]